MYLPRMNPSRFQRAFLRRVADFRQFAQLLDLLPDVSFFVKDRRSRFVMNNRFAVSTCGVGSEAETIGKQGYEFYPHDRMAVYLEQDERVMRTGRPIINAICPAPQRGNEALIVFSKVPLRDRRGRVIGLAGIWREVRGLRGPPSAWGRLSGAVERMHERCEEPLQVNRLAAAAGLSRSQFDRQFRRLFGCSPREYLLRIRVGAAARLLEETARTTTDIAQATGFFDHSHFSRTFRRLMGCTPLAFRRRRDPALPRGGGRARSGV